MLVSVFFPPSLVVEGDKERERKRKRGNAGMPTSPKWIVGVGCGVDSWALGTGGGGRGAQDGGVQVRCSASTPAQATEPDGLVRSGKAGKVGLALGWGGCSCRRIAVETSLVPRLVRLAA